jgi:hypothetical protein
MASSSELRRALLEPAARVHGVDYDTISLFGDGDLAELPGTALSDLVGEPGTPREAGPTHVAFGLLTAGALILQSKTYADEFPAKGSLARKASKQLVRALGSDASIEASSLLAKALAINLSEAFGAVDDPEEAHLHSRLGEMVVQHYPVPEHHLNRLQDHRATAWERARQIRRVGSPERDDPDRMSQPLASQDFQLSAIHLALEVVLGEGWWGAKEDNLVRPGSSAALILGLADGVTWNTAADTWKRFGRAALDLRLV